MNVTSEPGNEVTFVNISTCTTTGVRDYGFTVILWEVPICIIVLTAIIIACIGGHYIVVIIP